MMGVEGVLLLLLPRSEGMGNNGVPGRVGAGLTDSGRGYTPGPRSAPEARRWGAVGIWEKMGCANPRMENLG